ncbi:NU155-like protein, partial [Mya arenaria]
GMSYGNMTTAGMSHQDMLEGAGRLVDKHLLEDRTSQPTVSGLHDFDYPSLLDTGVGLEGLSEISQIKRVPLPPELVEQFSRMQCNCMMGLFPDIDRAWLSIDSDIFVWKFEDGGDLAYFDGINETILSAALVKPRKVPHSVPAGPGNPCGYCPSWSQLFTYKFGTLSFLVPSFLNFSFGEEDSLVQIKVDNTRNILYCRTEKGTIQVYDLGVDGRGLSKVASIPLQNIVHNASHVARTIDRSNFKPLVHIAPIPSTESTNVHLVAITQTGVRLYFTTNPFGSQKGRPSMLTLIHTTVPVDGRTWSVCEVEYQRPSQTEGDINGRDPPVVVTQHAQPPRKFVVLSAQGSHIVSKLRPVDQLRQLLIDCQGPDADEVKAFFRLHKIEQACATCLILACNRLASDQQVADWAKMAFFQYGGEAVYTYGAGDRQMMPSNIGPAGMHPTQASTPMMYGAQPMYPPMDMTMQGGPGFIQNISFSGKHNGICLFLSRILRPIWEMSVTKEFPCQTPEGTIVYLTCNFASEDLGFILDNVRELLIWDLQIWVEAQKLEKVSLQHVQELIHRVEEVLGLLRVLVDHQFHTLAACLTKDQQNQLKTLSLKQFAITGKELCGSMIQNLINRYIDDNATTDAISIRLREICPSLYSTDDATCSKANEMLQAAKLSQSPAERRQRLMEALRPLALSEVCNQFASVHFYEGIVDLCLTMANKRDPQRLALHFYHDDMPEDMQGVQELMARKDCYKCITETLGYLMTASVPQGATVIPKSPGPPPAPDASRMSIEDADHYIQTPFLEPFLKQRSSYQAGDVAALDLLWKYYEKIENYPAAARILARLAERHGVASAAEGEFLHELEEKMEVARLQMNVLRALSQETIGGPNVQEAISKLESDLLDITMLYEEFADRFDLSECKLAIVNCAGLYDSALIENLWQNIVDKEFENTRSSATSVRVKNIGNKLCAVGKTYFKAERYFPFPFITKYLEQRSCENGMDVGWVYQLMLDIGVPALRLLELYDRMFKSRDPFWSSVDRPWHLRQFSTLGLDYIACYLVELQSVSSVDPNVRTLVQSFRNLQGKMERLMK